MISDLYADPDIVAALRRHDVQVPDEADWQVTDVAAGFLKLHDDKQRFQGGCSTRPDHRSTVVVEGLGCVRKETPGDRKRLLQKR